MRGRREGDGEKEREGGREGGDSWNVRVTASYLPFLVLTSTAFLLLSNSYTINHTRYGELPNRMAWSQSGVKTMFKPFSLVCVAGAWYSV